MATLTTERLIALVLSSAHVRLQQRCNRGKILNVLEEEFGAYDGRGLCALLSWDYNDVKESLAATGAAPATFCAALAVLVQANSVVQPASLAASKQPSLATTPEDLALLEVAATATSTASESMGTPSAGSSTARSDLPHPAHRQATPAVASEWQREQEVLVNANSEKDWQRQLFIRDVLLSTSSQEKVASRPSASTESLLRATPGVQHGSQGYQLWEPHGYIYNGFCLRRANE